MTDGRTVTTVEIGGEQYTIRSEASREYTEACAEYVNQTIKEIVSRGTLIEAHKAAILAALALADQLLQARAEMEGFRSEMASRSARLIAEIEEHAPSPELASAD